MSADKSHSVVNNEMNALFCGRLAHGVNLSVFGLCCDPVDSIDRTARSQGRVMDGSALFITKPVSGFIGYKNVGWEEEKVRVSVSQRS